jgi:hypothetical protein
MVFDYTIIENNIEADTDSQEFIDHIGDILVVVLDEELKKKPDLIKKEDDGKN